MWFIHSFWPLFSNFIFGRFQKLVCLCVSVSVYMCHGRYTKVKGQLCEASSCFLHMGCRDQTKTCVTSTLPPEAISPAPDLQYSCMKVLIISFVQFYWHHIMCPLIYKMFLCSKDLNFFKYMLQIVLYFSICLCYIIFIKKEWESIL